MTFKFPAWSYSSLTAFETCPKRYFHTRVAKDVADPPHESAVWGTRVHEQIEKALLSPDPVSAVAELPHATAIAPLVKPSATMLVEYKMCVNASLEPTGWFSPDAWCRGIIDFGIVTPSGSQALLLDWKTGKRKPESTQLKLFAGLAFAHMPDLREIRTGFVWLKEGKTDAAKFEKDDAPGIWSEFMPRVIRMKRAFDEGVFPPKPSGLCAKWCPVPKRTCQFSGKQ